ncbi:MAG: ParB/RepB/Spo0J family partition protein [Bacteroidetes bacterium]|jgi:ParB family transcriptional regulator, chromosome partitioning protein|nr:ParB/RepB/Spo0J family partition protein [Bacteroidota bacterium]MBT6687821.1 ParB/RepB/Spo0J family partition protein [Bacteroidota bacterium]MBT7142111.1 ParB/RepB/Spo0J family partition protein [Bacteroidota bacterium]MBT7492381.1 ParB/RepB/Spo0J family partition protein [Bacteroidota bacterium]
MAKKNVLGRGLGALISDADEIISPKNELINEIKIDKIEVNPFQPRKEFNEEKLNELAQSIKNLGVIQPITVRKINEDKYQLITGERRLRASKIAGLSKIPSYTRTANDSEILEMALVENIQREDLDAIEIAQSYQQLIDECNLTQENLSERVGKGRATVTNYLRLLKLTPEVQLGIKNNKIQMGHARALVNIQNPEKQIEICLKIIDAELSVRKAEELISKINLVDKHSKNKPKGKYSTPTEYHQLENHLSKYFKTNIQFVKTKKGNGRIVIPFKSDSELEYIIELLDKKGSEI